LTIIVLLGVFIGSGSIFSTGSNLVKKRTSFSNRSPDILA